MLSLTRERTSIMLVKFCGCGKLIPYGQHLCPDCQARQSQRHKLYDAHTRNKRAAEFYNSALWHGVRDKEMAISNYQCAVCRTKGIVTPADEVHHIIPIEVDWSKRLDADNLVCLCHRHHMEAHAKLNSGARGAVKKY